MAIAKDDKAQGRVIDTPVTLFRHIVNSDLPPSEMHEDRLMQEAMVLIGAGTSTVSRALEFVCYYIIANEGIRFKLQEELCEPMAEYPDKIPSWSRLEKLPYLNAIIKESLR